MNIENIKYRAVLVSHSDNKFLFFSYWGFLDYHNKSNKDAFRFLPATTSGYILTNDMYTGKKDMNGEDLYENDIIEGNRPYSKYHIITWDDKRCGFYLKPIDGFAAYDKGYKLNSGRLKKIGNIHTDSELITKLKNNV